MKTTYLACLGGVVLATLVACGDDETGGSSTTGSGNAGNTGTGNSGNTGNSGSGGDGNSSSGGSGGDGNSSSGGSGGEGEGGGSGGGSNANAEAFCADFDEFCGFGEGYADEPACIAAFNGYAPARQACVIQHVAYAETEPNPHCDHAAGAAPCN